MKILCLQVPLSFITPPDSPTDSQASGDSSASSIRCSRSSSDFMNSTTFNIEGAVQSCLSFKPKATPEELCRGMVTIDLRNWMSWVNEEPQCLVWASLIHRITMSEETVHKHKCSVCATYPIKGFRYRCMKCFNFNLCQNCFFMGLNYQFHKPTHPIQEYCTSQTSSEGVRVMLTVLKNRFIPSKYQLAYLPTANSNLSTNCDLRSSSYYEMSKAPRDESAVNERKNSSKTDKYDDNQLLCLSTNSFRPIRAKSVDDLDRRNSLNSSKQGRISSLTAYDQNVMQSSSPSSILSNKLPRNNSVLSSSQANNAYTLRKQASKNVQFIQTPVNGRKLSENSGQTNQQQQQQQQQQQHHQQQQQLQQQNANHVSFHLLTRSNDSLCDQVSGSVHMGVPPRHNSATPSLCRSSSTFRGNGKN